MFDPAKSTTLSGEKFSISVGPVVDRGENLPSGRNLAEYFDHRGYMRLIDLFRAHKKAMPTLWIIIQCRASARCAEVGCERFFSLSGYVSAPRRTRLKVKTYERLAMLASIIPKMYIDLQWVAKEYLRRCEEGAWKKDDDEKAVKCWNLERVIDAELSGQRPPKQDITLEGSW